MARTGLSQGARNLHLNCAGIQPHERVRIVHEDPAFGWYDADIYTAILQEVVALGIDPDVVTVGPPGGGDGARISRMTHAYDCTIFLARIADQDRSADPVPGHRAIMIYARDAAMLASRYGRTDHRAMLALKRAVDAVVVSAHEISITCPLGTALRGTWQPFSRSEPADVSVHRFPMGVPAPVPASGFSGRIALAHYLTPTGSQCYEPPCVRLDGTVFASVEAGRITGFSGIAADVERVERHYDRYRLSAITTASPRASGSTATQCIPGTQVSIRAATITVRWMTIRTDGRTRYSPARATCISTPAETTRPVKSAGWSPTQRFPSTDFASGTAVASRLRAREYLRIVSQQRHACGSSSAAKRLKSLSGKKSETRAFDTATEPIAPGHFARIQE